MFDHLEIETIGACNRTCSWCMRNTDPDRERAASHFSYKQLPTEDIQRIAGEAVSHGFTGTVCLSHYNEPLLDERIVELGGYMKQFGLRTMMCSNADRLTEGLAEDLDQAFDYIRFSFYMDDPARSERMHWCKSLFKRCYAETLDGSHILPTHFSEVFQIEQIAESFRERPCFEPSRRMIVNHEGKMLLCCNDMTGRFGLPTIYDGLTIGELWYSARRTELSRALEVPGGRSVHSHCLNCPRPT